MSRLFSLRTLVVGLAVLVLVFGEDFSWLSSLDRLLFVLAQSLLHPASAHLRPLLPLPSESALPSLLAHAGMDNPIWAAPVERGLLIAVTLLLVGILPRLRTGTGLLLSLLFAVGMVLAQVALQLYGRHWVPLGEVTTFLAAGLIVMLFWLHPHRQIDELRVSLQDTRVRLGKVLLQQGQLEETLAAVDACAPTADALALKYDVAIRQEKRRDYESAIRVYREIVAVRKQYKDVAERLEALQQVDAGSGGGALDGTRTLVLSETAVSKPTLGRYEIQRELGRGAMGVVYLGRDPHIARSVAIKTLNYDQFDPGQLKDLKSRFFREAEAAGRLSHANIITVYDVGEERDLAFIAMDFAEGRPLSAFAKTKSLLPVATVYDIVARIADALAYAHEQKVIHRDIKPANIIYDPQTGALKVTDFGIAKLSDDSRTKTGSVLGSPLYMSPEQLKGQKVSGASDLYSLGVTFFKLLTAETPYHADTLANLTYQILNKRPRSVREFRPDLPASAVRIINKAIQKDPAKRFASAEEMADAVRKALSREFGREVSC
ncbi:serine/threonine-protein kinase [Mangrovitalea sediminis]|uniref:serine/threonine-protein kinase n=1 Tax=Mangrovitalea sediminis TaxID=1982043 RepID=UPI000BE6101C|nr:serine/threonine-protein kinase [Mangrovitalea sediminis]